MTESTQRPSHHRIALAAHVLPFFAWIAVMSLLGEPAGWKYAVRTFVCLALLLGLRPWRWYGPLRLRHVPAAVGVGALVFVVWVAGETELAARWPWFQHVYRMLNTMPPWKAPELTTTSVYAPEVCGWGLTVLRLLGSACVISFIEEFFWRGFVYRWFIHQDFLSVDPGRMQRPVFWLVAVAFGLEHSQWMAGLAAGAAFGWLMIRTRDIWAAGVAHAVANLLLGIYVIVTGKYQFWS